MPLRSPLASAEAGDPESGFDFQDFELQQRRRALQHELRQLGRLHERNLVSDGKLAKEQERIERKLEKLDEEDRRRALIRDTAIAAPP